MAPQASSVMTMPRQGELNQFQANLRLARRPHRRPDKDDNRLRPLDVAQCSLCGMTRPLDLLVPDGGSACADIRWYCKDAKSCTERWTAARPGRPAYPSADPDHGSAGAGGPAPAGLSAQRAVGMLGAAQSVT